MFESRYVPREPDLCLSGSAQEALHQRAIAAARERFGRQVFVRGVVEVSNYCRENCAYCGMRRDHQSLSRYRADHAQLAEMLIHRRPITITDINIQSGEDPVALRQVVLPLIRTLRRETPLGVSVSLGTLNRELYGELQAAGATIYIMKFECGDAAQYQKFAAPGSLDERLQHIGHLAGNGWSVSSGFIVGLPGQGPSDLVSSLRLAATLPLRGCSVSPFISGEDTPLAGQASADANWTLNCMAALRLMRPDWVIPAVSALNLADKDGYRRGLSAGANLVTMNLTPDELRGEYVIYKRDRFIMTEARVLDAIEGAGLAPSRLSLADYYRNGGNGNCPA